MYSRKFQITVEKNLPQALTCHLAVMTKLKLFHVVERKMYHARQTFEINCHSTKTLIFDLTKIVLPKRLVLTYSLMAKVLHYQIFTELKSSY